MSSGSQNRDVNDLSSNFFGVLLAGLTPEVNDVQIHQDKLGEYTRTGGTLHGRPAYKKDNNTNHMLWFCFATDGTPTWYVGKEEEFGQARGWLQVKSEAQTPHEIKDPWSVWSVSERRWKEAPDVKCIAVSATAGVIIHGPTPSNLLQDKLGEYRRVQLRVITERGVYEMVGMPNVMMWYAPGGTWNIGKRDELGQNRGWYQAVSKAISPEGIANWQVWDGANKKWEKASDLEAISVGSKRIAYTGTTPKGVNADKLGEYARKQGDFQKWAFRENRAVYECVDTPSRSIWYTKPYWYVGQTEDVGKAQGWLCCKDDAPCPEQVKAAWRVSDGSQMVDAADVRCMPVGATTVMVAGETPNDLNSDKLGEFARRVGQEVNGRPIYAQVGNDNRMLWYAAGYWYLGKKNELGKSQGWLCVRDPAPAPELVQSCWRVGDGERLHQAPNVRCAAIGARTIEIFGTHAQVLGAPLNGLHKDKMGEFRMISATEVNGKPVYEKEPSISHMVWASNGYWYVGKRDELGKQAGWMQVRDSAPLPEEISGVWQIWNQMDKRWIPSENIRVTAVGNERVCVTGPTPAACALYADKLGTYRRVKGQEVNSHAFYRRSEVDCMLWHAAGVWWIGPSASVGKQSGFWRCQDSARIPEAIKGVWEVGDGNVWHKADGVGCAEHVRTRVILSGATPGERHQDKLGTYELCEGELVNDRVCYQQVGNPLRMIWFLTPYWYVGKRDEKALGQGWVQVRSLAPVPELITGVWSVWNSTERKWVEAPELRIAPDETCTDDGEPLDGAAAANANAAPPSAIPRALPIHSDDESPPLGGSATLATAAGATSTGAMLSTTLANATQPGPCQLFLLHEASQDVHGRLLLERVGRVHDFLRTAGCQTWYEPEPATGNFLEAACAALDESDIVLVFVSGRSLDRIAGKNGAYDSLKKQFEYAERTKGAERLIPVVLEPSLVAPRDWWGGVGMVLGSRPCTDLSQPEPAGTDANLRKLLKEIGLMRGASSAGSADVAILRGAAGAGAAAAAACSTMHSHLTTPGETPYSAPIQASPERPSADSAASSAASSAALPERSPERPSESVVGRAMSSSLERMPSATTERRFSTGVGQATAGQVTSTSAAPMPVHQATSQPSSRPASALGLGDMPADGTNPGPGSSSFASVSRAESVSSIGSSASAALSVAPHAGGSKSAPSTPLGERTMAQKVARVKEELSLEPSLPVAKAVAEANAVMGIEGQGSLARQVDCLLTELGVL